uniref:Uncharacterized protein n=1 Tax=viral metagenome TaxID=1070528 RepID=A0A6C0IWM8_9ZZZZ
MNTDILKPTDINEIDEIYNLTNICNYYSHITTPINEILSILMLLLKEYVTLIFKKNIKNKYIIHTGLNTLLHVFHILFYYTKNLKLTCYYTQQAYHIYLDFIHALNNMSISVLNLKTNDAVMFVYKKTIFEICNEYKRNINNNISYNSIDDTNIFAILNKITSTYKMIIQHIINNHLNLFTSTSTSTSTFDNDSHVNVICNYLTQLNTIICSKRKDEEVLDLLHSFISKLLNQQNDSIVNIDCNMFMLKIDYFLTTIYKKNCLDKASIMRIKNNLLKINDNDDEDNNELNNKLIAMIICGNYEN